MSLPQLMATVLATAVTAGPTAASVYSAQQQASAQKKAANEQSSALREAAAKAAAAPSEAAAKAKEEAERRRKAQILSGGQTLLTSTLGAPVASENAMQKTLLGD